MAVLRGGLEQAFFKWSEARVSRQVFTLRGHGGEVISVAFSPDGKSIVSGSDDKLVKIWDSETGTEVSSFRVRAFCVHRRCPLNPDLRYLPDLHEFTTDTLSSATSNPL